jgi:hypothetical protein
VPERRWGKLELSCAIASIQLRDELAGLALEDAAPDRGRIAYFSSLTSFPVAASHTLTDPGVNRVSP